LRLRKAVAGIDLGHRAVKGVILKRSGKKVHLERYFYTDLATVFPGYPEERDPVRVLSAMMEMHGLKGVSTATALPDDQVFNLEISLPPMPQSDLRAAVQFEASNQTRIPEGDLVIDFWECTRPRTQQDTNLRLRAFAARIEHVKKHMDQLKGAGFSPLSIESRMLANIEALRHNGYVHAESQCAIIDLGDSETVTGFVQQGVLKYCRSEKLGSGAMNSAIRERTSIAFAEADRRKLEHRFNEAMADAEIQEALEGVYFRIFKAIKDTIEGFLDSTPGARLENILLVGGGSRAPKIDEIIHGFFGVPVLLANPLKNIELYSGERAGKDDRIAGLAPQLTTAIGLALRGVE
jgi:type IV pilus assembly protein PilM